jgi:hypothetical protein
MGLHGLEFNVPSEAVHVVAKRVGNVKTSPTGIWVIENATIPAATLKSRSKSVLS